MITPPDHSDHYATRAVEKINHAELLRLRQVWGKDLNEWHGTLSDLKQRGKTGQALSLLSEIMEATLRLAQYDQREPQPYWFTQASWLHERRGEHRRAAQVLQRWMDAWPQRRAIPWKRRRTVDRQREQIGARIDRLLRLAGRACQHSSAPQ